MLGVPAAATEPSTGPVPERTPEPAQEQAPKPQAPALIPTPEPLRLRAPEPPPAPARASAQAQAPAPARASAQAPASAPARAPGPAPAPAVRVSLTRTTPRVRRTPTPAPAPAPASAPVSPARTSPRGRRAPVAEPVPVAPSAVGHAALPRTGAGLRPLAAPPASPVPPTSPGPTTSSASPAPPAPTTSSAPPASGSSDLPEVPDLPVGAQGVGVFKEERDVLDFGRITKGRVASVAPPVAAVGRLPRRKNLIGTETTGSIPVHLLFREDAARPPAAPGAPADKDPGPDTVSMAPPTGRTPARDTSRDASRTVIPRPAGAHAKAAGSARPAPTADPGIVERAARVLPGWVGVAGGLLALAGCAAVVWWAGALPAGAARMLRLPPRPYHGIHLAQWGALALGVLALLFAVGGLGRGRVGYAWVLTLFGEYRGTVRRTGLVWASPLLLRRRVDVRLRHWRSEPLPAVDAKGTALDVTVLVVWRVRDTVRAALAVDDHEDYLREQVEAAMARVLSQLPADAFHEDAPTLRDAEAVGEALTRMLSAECAPVGLDVFSAQPTRIEYAPEVAEAMRRRRIAAIDAKHRDSVLTSVVDAVDDVVHRLTSRGLVELDDYERKALVKDLTVAFYTGRGGPGEGA
ncbi:SPFH domain-containing protein [Streptomyces filamentosus]|uniref:SPFH domain-containing protein n=1 Tax=Streptomyces filamentosus TaxID=67294 RepID=UPI003570E730